MILTTLTTVTALYARPRLSPCLVDPARQTTCTVGARRYAVPPKYLEQLRFYSGRTYIVIDERKAVRK